MLKTGSYLSSDEKQNTLEGKETDAHIFSRITLHVSSDGNDVFLRVGEKDGPDGLARLGLLFIEKLDPGAVESDALRIQYLQGLQEGNTYRPSGTYSVSIGRWRSSSNEERQLTLMISNVNGRSSAETKSQLHTAVEEIIQTHILT